MNPDAASDPRRLGVPKEVVDEGARTLRHAAQSLDAFVGSLTEGTAVEGMSPVDAGWVSSSHHRHRTARSRLGAWAGWSTQLTLGNIFDHVRAIERTLVGEPVAIWSLVSLSRVVQEGAIRVCHLYESGLSPEQRAVRIAAAWLNGARQYQVAAKDVSVQAVPEAEKIWQVAERTVQRAGMSIGLDGRGRPSSARRAPRPPRGAGRRQGRSGHGRWCCGAGAMAGLEHRHAGGGAISRRVPEPSARRAAGERVARVRVRPWLVVRPGRAGGRREGP